MSYSIELLTQCGRKVCKLSFMLRYILRNKTGFFQRGMDIEDSYTEDSDYSLTRKGISVNDTKTQNHLRKTLRQVSVSNTQSLSIPRTQDSNPCDGCSPYNHRQHNRNTM